MLRVTEHPGASSFPSGHTIFIVTLTTVLMLRRFLPRWAQAVGWAPVVLLVAANAIGRIYVGAHWPTDIVDGVAWLTFILPVTWVSDRAFAKSDSSASRGASSARGAVPVSPT